MWHSRLGEHPFLLHIRPLILTTIAPMKQALGSLAHHLVQCIFPAPSDLCNLNKIGVKRWSRMSSASPVCLVWKAIAVCFIYKLTIYLLFRNWIISPRGDIPCPCQQSRYSSMCWSYSGLLFLLYQFWWWGKPLDASWFRYCCLIIPHSNYIPSFLFTPYFQLGYILFTSKYNVCQNQIRRII